MTATGLTAHDLMQHGLMIDSGPSRIGIELRFERPAFVYGHRLKGCSIGAFTYFNAAGTSSAYRCNIGRYAQIGESSILGPPEHPMDWFSSHPFTFTRPKYMPNMYRFEDFARLAPDAQEGPSYADSMPIETTIGHEAYVGVSSFIKRGVRIGHGAVVGAKSIVTRDVPDYAIVVGSPAKVVRMRFAEPIVERFLKLQWWLYDLAPHKNRVDFSKTEATLAYFEEQLAEGHLERLVPATCSIRPGASGYDLETLPAPLY